MSAPLWVRFNTDGRRKSIANRKTVTSSEVKTRWINANYKRYGVSLRIDADADIIEYLERHKDTEGKGTTEIFRAALNEYIQNHGD